MLVVLVWWVRVVVLVAKSLCLRGKNMEFVSELSRI